MAATVGSSRTVADSALYAQKVSLGPLADDHSVGKRTYLLGLNDSAAAVAAGAADADAADAVAGAVVVVARSHSGSTPEMAASKCNGRLSTAWLSSEHCLSKLLTKDLAHLQVCCSVG